MDVLLHFPVTEINFILVFWVDRIKLYANGLIWETSKRQATGTEMNLSN